MGANARGRVGHRVAMVSGGEQRGFREQPAGTRGVEHDAPAVDSVTHPAQPPALDPEDRVGVSPWRNNCSPAARSLTRERFAHALGKSVERAHAGGGSRMNSQSSRWKWCVPRSRVGE